MNYPLTPRQKQVVRLLRDGETVPQIAARLGIKKNTVKQMLLAAARKMGIPPASHSFIQLVALTALPPNHPLRASIERLNVERNGGAV